MQKFVVLEMLQSQSAECSARLSGNGLEQEGKQGGEGEFYLGPAETVVNGTL